MADAPAEDVFRRLTALVVDDSGSTRMMLRKMLERWHFDVMEAEDGAAALQICRARRIDFVISDWMMPGLSGPELCRELRALRQDHFTYIILMTSKSATGDIAEGLDAGADDFLVKPANATELRARLNAGQRLVRMQEDLVEKNQRISEAYERLNTLYEGIERDLRAAARLQSRLIPPAQSACGPFEIGLSYRPAGHVGGDLLGFYPIADHRIAAYSFDVSGHGVSSALMTATLAGLFDPVRKDENIGLIRTSSGHSRPRDPAAIAADLDFRLGNDPENDLYLTLVMADLNADNGMVRFCQAGHPHPLVLRREGAIESVGEGGMPVGLIDGAQYQTGVVHLASGDRFLMFSDGITEAATPDGGMVEEAGLISILNDLDTGSVTGVLDAVVDHVQRGCGPDGCDDDISAIMIRMP